jgi:type II secretory pathway component GspD/PulD (secretin)
MKRLAAAACAALTLASVCSAQQIREIEFRNQPIVDILLALAEMSGSSIVPDETVSGTASYYFNQTDFETALRIFLATYKMYSWKQGSISYVSRVRCTVDKDAGTAALDAEDVEPRLIVGALSRTIGKTILFDPLPREAITIHVENAKPSRILEMLMKRFPDYQVDSADDYFYIRRLDAAGKTDMRGEKPSTWVTLRDGLYSVNAERARFRDLLTEIFRKAGLEYSLFLRGDTILENLHFSSKGLPEILRLVMDQANADYSIENGIYYVYEIQRADVMKKLKTVHSLPLTWLSVQDLPGLLPQDLASQSFLRLDRNTNTVILSGSGQEIAPVEEFIKALDRPLAQKKYYRFDLGHVKVSDLLPLLPAQFAGVKPVTLPQGSSFVMLLDPESKKSLDDFIALVDRKQGGVPILLKYIQSDFLLKNLPPSVAREDVQATGNSTLVFFNGSDDKLRQFTRELEALDRPTPQIRYELLVIEYQDGETLDWSASASHGALTDSARSNSFYGTIGKLLQLNFNVVSTFGTLFAVNLNLALNSNKAKVLADTTVNGLSGQDIRFQNTLTTRYRDLELNTTTQQLQSTGVTREVTSGLIITMNGWVSGDGMITMKVTSTVSKQGVDTSTTATGNPPSTSEKIVSTNVRTVTGKPVVIGGLMQQDKSVTVQKVPFLGDIPLLGLLFQSRNETVTNDEFVIYIVPHVEYPGHGVADESARMDALYRKFLGGK